MPRIETFNPEMLTRQLDALKLPYQRRDNDTFSVSLAGLLKFFNGPLQVVISRDPSKRHLLLHATLGVRLPEERINEAMGVCNEWNTNRIYPVAYVRQVSEDAKVLMTKSAIETSVGMHSELLDRFIRTAIAASREFFQWAHDEHKF